MNGVWWPGSLLLRVHRLFMYVLRGSRRVTCRLFQTSSYGESEVLGRTSTSSSASRDSTVPHTQLLQI